VIVVKRKKGESEDRLISRFRKRVISEKLLVDYKEKDRYKKPSRKKYEKGKRIKHLIELEKQKD
jgi:ribosomal protein S21